MYKPRYLLLLSVFYQLDPHNRLKLSIRLIPHMSMKLLIPYEPPHWHEFTAEFLFKLLDCSSLFFFVRTEKQCRFVCALKFPQKGLNGK